MSTAIERTKERLLARRRELDEQDIGSEQARSVVALDQTSVGRLSRMDAMQGQAMAQATQRRRQVEMQRISAALKRIEEDEYGWCIDCGDEIAAKRLEFDPTATLCIACAEERERKG